MKAKEDEKWEKDQQRQDLQNYAEAAEGIVPEQNMYEKNEGGAVKKETEELVAEEGKMSGFIGIEAVENILMAEIEA